MKKDNKGDPILSEEQDTGIHFDPIDPDKEGVTVGGGDTETLEFEKEGQRIVGILMDIREIDQPYHSKLYEVHNAHGEFSFWGGAILDDRLSKIPIGKIIDVTYNGEQKVKGGKNTYKTFTVRYYTPDEDFDPTQHTVYLDTNLNLIVVNMKGDDPPDTAIPF